MHPGTWGCGVRFSEIYCRLKKSAFTCLVYKKDTRSFKKILETEDADAFQS